MIVGARLAFRLRPPDGVRPVCHRAFAQCLVCLVLLRQECLCPVAGTVRGYSENTSRTSGGRTHCYDLGMYDFENLPTAEKVRQNGVFDAVLLKAKWAHDHICDLNNALDIFFDSNPYRIRHEQDSETLAYIYYFIGSNPFPLEIVGHVGDALHNLRSALDHLAWQLVLANGKTPGTGTGFPIYDPAMKEPESFFARKVQGMGPEAIKAIEDLKPYKGGNDMLWLLHELDRLDKHREIIGIGTAHVGDYALNSQRRGMAEGWRQAFPDSAPFPFSNVIIAAKEVRILKPGDVLRKVAQSDYDPKMDFQFQISFDIPGTAEVKPVIDTLKEMERVVTEIVCDFMTAGHFRTKPVTDGT